MDRNEELAASRRTVRVGIAGAGRVTAGCHIPAFGRMGALFTVSAICDAVKERRDSLAPQFPDARLFRRVEDLFEDPDVDLILVATPTPLHEEHVQAALSRGKWVVCEAPLATTHEAAMRLKNLSQKSRDRLIPCVPGLFAPEFLLAGLFRNDPRLGNVYAVRISRSDWLRRDDWQSVLRCGGGATWHTAPDALMQMLSLLRGTPANLWCDMKRLVGAGDAEDFLQLRLKTREGVTGEIDVTSARLPPFPPDLQIFGSRGVFYANCGAKQGILHVIDPARTFPKRRPSVRTPTFDDRHEAFEMVDLPVVLPDGMDYGIDAFWRAVYKTVRTAQEFPVRLDDAVEAIRFLHLAKKSSPF